MLVDSEAFIAIDGSFIVFIDCEFKGKPASFILHTEGNMRSILKLYLEHKHLLHEDIYFEMQHKPYFKNHAELISTNDGVGFYRFKGLKRWQ